MTDLVRLAFVALLVQTVGAGQQESLFPSVRGTVVRLGSKEPVAGATVVLTKDSVVSQSYASTTDPDGGFVFEKLQLGTYQLRVTQAGYQAADYAPRLSLESGDGVTGVRVVLTPVGTISGRITTGNRDPFPGAVVEALKPTFESGQRVLLLAGQAIADNLGDYRLTELPAGPYYVSAIAPGEPTRGFAFILPGTSARAADKSVAEIYMPVYFPNSVSPWDASRVVLGAGEARTGIDITTSDSVPARHVRGFVVDGITGKPGIGFVEIVSRDSNIAGRAVGTLDAGVYDISGILPGSYFVVASVRTPGNTASLIGRVPLEVGPGDAEGVWITATPGISVVGQITFDGPAPSQDDLAGTQQVVLSSDFQVATIDFDRIGRPSAGGAFTIQGVQPEDYRVKVWPLGTTETNAYLKSVRWGAVDVLADGLHIDGPSSGPSSTKLEITIGTNGAVLEGHVVDQGQDAAKNAAIILIPEPTYRGRSDLYKVTWTDNSGRFKMQGIAPGNYSVVALQQVEAGAWWNPEFIHNYESVAIPLHMEEGFRKSIELTTSDE